MSKVTKADVLMMVAQKLKQPFPVEDLIVEAWKVNKEMFGLDHFKEQHPNNNIILSLLMGKSGLVSKGKLVRVSTGLYKVA